MHQFIKGSYILFSRLRKYSRIKLERSLHYKRITSIKGTINSTSTHRKGCVSSGTYRLGKNACLFGSYCRAYFKGKPLSCYVFLEISYFVERVRMEHIAMKYSLECKLQIHSICSIRTRSRNLVFFK